MERRNFMKAACITAVASISQPLRAHTVATVPYPPIPTLAWLQGHDKNVYHFVVHCKLTDEKTMWRAWVYRKEQDRNPPYQVITLEFENRKWSLYSIQTELVGDKVNYVSNEHFTWPSWLRKF